MHSAEKARDTTLNDENASLLVTSVLVTALCNQPEAFASDLYDDQSCYLCVTGLVIWCFLDIGQGIGPLIVAVPAVSRCFLGDFSRLTQCM